MEALKAEETLRNFAEHWVSEETTSRLIAAVKAAAWYEGRNEAWEYDRALEDWTKNINNDLPEMPENPYQEDE